MTTSPVQAVVAEMRHAIEASRTADTLEVALDCVEDWADRLAQSAGAGVGEFRASAAEIIGLLTWIAERADMSATGYKFTYNEELPPTVGFPREVWDAIQRLKL